MVGSGGGGGGGGADRSKEAVGMMALHEALRSVCLNTDWTYSVFWTIRPRPRVRGGNGCKVGDDNGSLMLMWEDGYCRGSVGECMQEMDGEDPVRKAFSKMSIQLYNYGEGLMGKVASDKCHKWVFKEPSECEPNISNYWQSSFDALPSEWTDQFESGIQTIAVIQAGHGLLQLGSCKIIAEDLHFVLRMRHTFESLGYQSGFYLSQLFSSTRNPSPSPSLPLKHHHHQQPPPSIPNRTSPLFNWGPRPLPSANLLSSPTFHNTARLGYPPQPRDDAHMFLQPHSSSSTTDHQQQPRVLEDMMGGGDHESDIKWPNGLTFFGALTGRSDDAKLLFAAEGKQDHNGTGGGMPDEFLSLDSHHQHQQQQQQQRQEMSGRKMENKFKRSFTLPARMASSSSSTSLDHHQQQPHNPGEYSRNSEGGMYSDHVMETFLE